MNLTQLWQLVMMILSAGAAMEALQPGASLHTGDAGIPPVFITWRDGRKFEVDFRIKRSN